MRLLRHTAWFPLLRKDLTELAQRRRTYVLRVIYAVALFGCFLVYFHEVLSNAGPGPTSMLGSGGQVFGFILIAQFAGIFVFLPAMMSGVVTYEKERRSLELLFLTDLGPWEILLEKYVGRLVPMFAFLLLSLPLLAIAYAYGGVPTAMLWASVYILALTCLQVGALALMCSAFFTSGAAAFIASYVLGFVVYFIVPAMVELMNGGADDSAFGSFPPNVLDAVSWGGMASVLSRSVPMLLSTTFFLLMARVFLVRRAFAAPGHLLRRVFRRMDVFWDKVNQRVGGIVLLKEADTLPEDEPVLWREVRTRSLARFSYLFRIFCVVEVPVLLIAGLCVITSWGSRDVGGLWTVVFVIWPIAALALAAAAGNTFASERVGQTLEVLLATPLSGEEIVRQKVRGLRRFMLVLAAPLVTMYVAEALVASGPAEAGVATYLTTSLLSVIVYFPLILWLSVWIGLRQRSRGMAAIVPVVVLFVWCALPIFVYAVFGDLVGLNIDLDGPPQALLLLTSPATMVIVPEQGDAIRDFSGGMPVLVILLNYAVYGALALFFRRLCLKNADRYLGRVPTSEGEEAYVGD